MITGFPRQLHWSDFTPIANPGPGQMVALNGHPIVARVGLSIMFYPGSSPMTADAGRYRFQSVSITLQIDQLQYVPSRIPHAMQAHYLVHEQGHMNLMGLFARELEVELMALRAPNSIELLNLARAATEQAVTNARMYAINTPGVDCIYDRETNHGMNAAVQTRWNRRIAANMARRQAADFHVQMS